MKVRIRLICLLLAAAMLLGLAACGSSDEGDEAETESESEATEEVEAETTESGGEEEAPAEQTTSSDDSPTYGGTLNMYYHEFYNYYDPAMPSSYSYAFWLESLWIMDWADEDKTYEGAYLTYNDVSGQLAESWEIADDFTSITVTVRDDVYFQDKEPFNGRQMTAEDVKYTYDRLLGLGSGWDEPVECEMNWPEELFMVESVELVDDYTVTFHFNTDTEVGLNIFMITVVNISGPEWDDCPQTWEYACGTGPYILSNVDVGNSMSYVKNENYYGYDERYPENRLPYIDEINLVHIDDSSNVMAQFIAGTIDWVGSTSAVLSSSEIAQMESTMDEDSYTEYAYSSLPPTSISLKVNQEPFDDVRVRIAMQKAINSEEIHHQYNGYDSDLVFPGIWSPLLEDYSTVDNWSAELQAEYEYDPEGAIALLEEAGYPDGFSFTIALAPVADVELFVLCQTYFAAVGIDMQIEQTAEIMEAIAVGTDASDPRVVSGSHGARDTLALVKMLTTPEGANYNFFHDDQDYLDAIAAFEQAETLADQAQYAQEMDRLFAEGHWSISLGGLSELREFMSNRVHGYSGERLVLNQYRRTVVARLWVDEI